MEFLFSLVLALALTHQLDAVRARIWRVLPSLNAMSEETARAVFIALHIPVILLLLEGAFPAQGGGFWRFFVALLGPLNFGLHRLLAEHPFYDFKGQFSQGLIIAYAGAGALYLLLSLVS